MVTGQLQSGITMARRKLIGFITGWYGISIINLCILFIAVNVIIDMVPTLFNTINNVEELEDMVDTLGIIFVAYGVALEERESLMNILHLYPAQSSPRQQFTDHVCHTYGLSLLLVGLFMELTVQLIKVPNRIINTDKIEWLIFSVAVAFIATSIYMMCRLSYFLLRPNISPEYESSQKLDS